MRSGPIPVRRIPVELIFVITSKFQEPADQNGARPSAHLQKPLCVRPQVDRLSRARHFIFPVRPRFDGVSTSPVKSPLPPDLEMPNDHDRFPRRFLFLP